jgi:hypothetical protein
MGDKFANGIKVVVYQFLSAVLLTLVGDLKLLIVKKEKKQYENAICERFTKKNKVKNLVTLSL